MAGLLALAAFAVLRAGGCSVAASGPPPGVPAFAWSSTGFTVTCGGGPDVLWLAHLWVLATAIIVWLFFALVFVQTIRGRHPVWLPVWPPLRPRLFAFGVAIEAAAVGLVALELLAAPEAAGRLALSNPLFIPGAVIMWYGGGRDARGRRPGVLRT